MNAPLDPAAARIIAAEIVRALRTEKRIDGLWGLAEIAEWAGISKRRAQDLVLAPGFPRAGRLPGAERGYPRWIAAEVIEWWNEHREAA